MFGYGSLLSIRSMERTLGRPYDGPFIPCAVDGWRRTWDAAMPNRTHYAEIDGSRMYPEAVLYLNVRREAGTMLNGTLFLVDETALAGFDKRESIYDRVDITPLLSGVVAGGPAYMYACRPEYRVTNVKSPRQAAVRATYVQIVEEGLAALGDDFRLAYDRSSDPVPKHLIIQDRTQPANPPSR